MGPNQKGLVSLQEEGKTAAGLLPRETTAGEQKQKTTIYKPGRAVTRNQSKEFDSGLLA